MKTLLNHTTSINFQKVIKIKLVGAQFGAYKLTQQLTVQKKTNPFKR
jgi:hypothetical protein